jgi:radical SAM superfamily enzyme YgiQ (UPF0313 family)
MKIFLANIIQPYRYDIEEHRGLLYGFYKLIPSLFKSIALSLPILAGLTPKEVSVELKNHCRYQDVNFDENYDLIGLSCVTPYAIEAYKIADEFRKRGKTVILGGWHPSVLPEEAKQHADSVVIGEAEDTWPQLLNDFKNNKLKYYYTTSKPVDPKKIPVLRHYSKKEQQATQATRGCPYGCEFCSITHTKFRNIFRRRPIENVIEEIKSMKHNTFCFYDNSLTIDHNYTKQLFRELKSLNKKFYAFGNINLLGNDEELLRLANEAGCVGWYIGFESVSQKSLDETNKRMNVVKEYDSAVKKIHDHGMQINGNFVFGFDHDTLEVFDNTLDVMKDLEIDLPDTSILTPFPGTSLFCRLEKEGRILTKDWSKYTLRHVVFQPKNMTPRELFDNDRRVYEEIYSHSNIIRRSLKSLKLGFVSGLQVSKRNIEFKNKRIFLYS